MKVHGNLHWIDDVVISLGENAEHSVIAINNLSTGTAWLLSVSINLHELESETTLLKENEVRN
jgi:hypothetical protein